MERSTNTSRLKKAQTKGRGTTVADAKKQMVEGKVSRKLGLSTGELPVGNPTKPGGFMPPTRKKRKTNKAHPLPPHQVEAQA